MKKIVTYLLFFVAFAIGFASCASSRSSKTKPYYPNQRKPPSGKTDNCDCPKYDRKGRRVSKIYGFYEPNAFIHNEKTV